MIEILPGGGLPMGRIGRALAATALGFTSMVVVGAVVTPPPAGADPATGQILTVGWNENSQLGFAPFENTFYPGAPRNGELHRPTVPAGIVEVEMSTTGTVWGIQADGDVVSWGRNDHGQAGQPGTLAVLPEVVDDLPPIVQVATGATHALLLSDDGRVFGVGDFECDGGYEDEPTQLPAPSDVIAIAASDGVGYTLGEDGTVWTWGSAYWGLGPDCNLDDTPVQVTGLSDITAIAAGRGHLLALTESGTVQAVGRQEWGALGDPSAGTFTATPITLPMTGVVGVEANWYTSFAISEDGELWGWGDNGAGQIGQGTSDNVVETPELIPVPGDVAAMATSPNHTMAVTESGALYSWGGNGFGELGHGHDDYDVYPFPPANLSPRRVVQVASATSVGAGTTGSVILGQTAGPLHKDVNALLGQQHDAGSAGDPVNTGTGNFYDVTEDVGPVNGAPAALLSRTYNSRDEGEPAAPTPAAGGMFGPGWTTFVDAGLFEVTPDLLVLHEPGGRLIEVPEVGGTWAAPADMRVTIDDLAGGRRQMTSATGVVTTFDDDGRIEGMTRPGGTELTVERHVSTGAPEAIVFERNGLEAARVTLIHTDGDGLVDAVESPGGIRRTYTYSGGRLASVSIPHLVGQPSPAAETYGWDAGGLLATIHTERGGTLDPITRVDNTYDELGRVTSQVQPDGDVTTFLYGQPDLLGVRSTTVTHTAGADVETMIYHHDDAGRVIGIEDPDGHVAERAWDDRRLDASTSRRGAVTDMAHDAAGRVVGITRPDPDAAGQPGTAASVTYCSASPDDARPREVSDGAGAVTRYAYGAPTDPDYPCAGRDATPTQVTTGYGTALAATTSTEVVDGLPVETVDPDGVETRWRWDATRALILAEERDPDASLPGSEVTFYGYDDAGRLIVERSPSGIETWTTYDAAGNTTSVIGPVAAPSRGCTALGDTCTFPSTPPSGPTVSATYRLDGSLASSTDAEGKVTRFTTTPTPGGGRVDTEARPDGSEVVATFDATGRVISEAVGDQAVPAEVAVTTYAYGPLGRLASVTGPTGVMTTYEYDEDGNQTAVIEEDGERTTTVYDLTGLVRSVTDPLDQVTIYDYDAAGRLIEEVDREGKVTTHEYDALGRLTKTIDARLGETTRTYTPGGRLQTVTDATNRTTTSSYDDAGRLVAEELASGATTTFGYDPDGRRTTVTSPEGRVTTTTYDDAGRTLTVTSPGAGTTTRTYDDRGAVLTETDATGGVVAFTYDEMGRVETVTDPLTEVTTYTYDSRGNRTSRTDARSGVREWHWNLADQLVEEVDPLDRSMSHTYDDLGRIDVTTDGAGRTTDRGYDAAGHVTSLTYATGTPTTFGYDGEGRRTSMVDSTGTTTWSYNATGLMTGANLPGSRDLAFAWDLAGRRTVIDYPDGARYRNRYDTDGRLSEVEHDQSGTWVDVAVNTYDDDGLLLEQDQGTSGARAWTYDAITGRLASYAESRGATTTTTSLTHDAAGRISSETTGGVSTVYDYDEAGQLTLVDRSTGADETYAYDELGRRTTAVVGSTTTTYQWDAASQLNRRVINGANRNYQYDTSGRRTRDAWNGGANVIQHFWGSRGTMTGQRYTEPGTVTDTSRATRGDGTLATLTTTVNGSPADTTSIVWDPTLPVPQPVWTGDPGTANATRAIYGPDLIRFTCPTGTSCTGPATHDHLGSTLETTATSAVTQDTTYTPWGDGGPTYTPGADYGYRSELHTGATVYLRARDYDPETGLFLSADLLDGVDGTTTVANSYQYADNDPVNRGDPLGLRASEVDVSDPCPDDFRDWEDIDEPTCTLPPTISPNDERHPVTGPHPVSARCDKSMAPGGPEWYDALWSPRVAVDCNILVSKKASTALHYVMVEHQSRTYMVKGMCGEGPLSAFNQPPIYLDRSLIADSLEERLGALSEYGLDTRCTSMLGTANGSISDSLARAFSLSSQCLAFRFRVESLGLDFSDPSRHAPAGWGQININLKAGSYVLIHRRDWHARGCPEAYVGQTPEDLDITDFIDG